MEHSLLARFNGDKHTKEAVFVYFTQYFEGQIVKRAKEKQPVESLADAIVELEKAFEQLSIDYAAPKLPSEVSNESR